MNRLVSELAQTIRLVLNWFSANRPPKSFFKARETRFPVRAQRVITKRKVLRLLCGNRGVSNRTRQRTKGRIPVKRETLNCLPEQSFWVSTNT